MNTCHFCSLLSFLRRQEPVNHQCLFSLQKNNYPPPLLFAFRRNASLGRKIPPLSFFAFRRIASIFLLLSLAISCSPPPKHFSVSGSISHAEGQVLFLDAVSLDSTSVLDSLLLSQDGSFHFQAPAPPFPEFYRLRLNDLYIHFAIDSTESIHINSSFPEFHTSYTISGTPANLAIRDIALASLQANQALSRLHKTLRMNLTHDTSFVATHRQIVDAYKNLALQYIYTAPGSTPAYFALFQQAGGMLLFDIYDQKDSKAFAAVATSFDRLFHDAPRTTHLHQLALQSLSVTRRARLKNGIKQLDAKEVGFLNIALPNVHGEVISLANLIHGKVTLINFIAYASEWSPHVNMKLNDLHQAFASKGLLIYQVSLDSDVHLWRNAAVNAPWITVFDPQSYHSEIAALYAVQRLPTFFLLDRQGNIVKRIEHLDELEKEIPRHL